LTEAIVSRITTPDLASPEFKANPYPFYARLRAEAPAHRIRLTTMPLWLVTRYDDVLLVLKDERFSNRWTASMPWLLRKVAGPLTRHLLNQDPPDHTRLRSLVSKAFTPRRVEELRGRMQAVCDGLLEAAAPVGRFELMHGFALPLPLTVIGDMLGVPAVDRFQLNAWLRTVLAVNSTVALLRGLRELWQFRNYFLRLVAERRANPRDDLVSALIEAEEAGDKLSEAEVLGMVFLLLIAGYETTVNLIGNGTLALLQHPVQAERFRREPALAESAVEELLRYTSPLEIASARYAREDATFGSVVVRRGQLVAAVVGSANHDQAQFSAPDTLDLARQPNRHLAFGMGPHFCLGASLARLEARIALTTLFRRFPNLRLADGENSVRWRRALVVRGLDELRVAF
jgi:cytochrome P450 PksS